MGLVAVLFAMIWLPVSASSPPSWGPPIQIGSELSSSWFPDIYADGAGNVLLTWSASLTDEDANEKRVANGGIMVSRLDQTGWSTPGDVYIMDGGIASRPIIASDGTYAHLIFLTPSGVVGAAGMGNRLFHMRAPLSADLGDAGSWTNLWPISDNPSYWAQLVVLKDGSLVALYNQIAPKESDDDDSLRTALFVRKSTDHGDTWSPPVRVSRTAGRVARVSVAVQRDDATLIAAWDEGYDNLTGQGTPSGISTATSFDGGLTWTNHHRFGVRAEQSTVAINGTTTILVYRSTTGDRLLYRRSDDFGVSWSKQEFIPDAVARPYSNPHNFDKLSTAWDGDGRLLLAYVGTDRNAPKGVSVMLTTYFDGAWGTPEVLSSPNGHPEYPRICVTHGRFVYLTFFVRPNGQYELGNYSLWLMVGESNAQRIEPLAYPTVEPAVGTSPTAVAATIPSLEVTQPPAPTPLSSQTHSSNTSPQATVSAPLSKIVLLTIVSLLVVLCLSVAAERLVIRR
jgi:hypothetical protein